MNARQAAEAGSGERPARVRMCTAPAEDGRIRVEVRDAGPGIPADDLPRIFDPFFTTRTSGTGLGLALTRNIIEGLGGSITIHSTRGEGTEVRIELPVSGRSA
jgi:signal transduction histidine kinase